MYFLDKLFILQRHLPNKPTSALSLMRVRSKRTRRHHVVEASLVQRIVVYPHAL